MTQENKLFVGRIVRLQVQRSGLKVKHPEPHYDPQPLLAVQETVVSTEGVIGLTDDVRYVASDGEVVDVHHAKHPRSRNNNGNNGISIGFSPYYERMREQFGAHMVDGIAGENVLIESERIWTMDDLASGLVIMSAASGQSVNLNTI